MRIRLVALPALVLAFVATAGPALADPPTPKARVEWRRFEDGRGRQVNDDHLAGRVRISAEIVVPDGLRGWTLDIVAAPGADHPGFGRVCQDRLDAEADSAVVDCVWDSVHLPDGSPSANQGYLARIAVDGGRGPAPSPDDAERSVRVSNPAAAPQELRVEYDEGTRRVRLRWKANPEPDVAGYVVEQRRGRRRWTVIGEPAGPALEQLVDEPGTYRYRVGARRGDSPSGRPGAWCYAEPVAVPAGGSGAPAREAGPSEAGPSEAGSSEAGSSEAAPPDAPGPGAPAERTGEEGAAPPSSPPPSSPSSPPLAPAPAEDAAPAAPPPAAPPPAPPPGGESLAPAAESPSPGRGFPPEPPSLRAAVRTWSIALPVPSAVPPPSSPPARAPTRRPRSPHPAQAAQAAGSAVTPAAPPVEPDRGYSLALPYARPAVPKPAAPGLTRTREWERIAAPWPSPGPGGIRRSGLALIAMGQLLFVLAMQTRYLLHGAGGRRLAAGLPRAVPRCPTCQATW